MTQPFVLITRHTTGVLEFVIVSRDPGDPSLLYPRDPARLSTCQLESRPRCASGPSSSRHWNINLRTKFVKGGPPCERPTTSRHTSGRDVAHTPAIDPARTLSLMPAPPLATGRQPSIQAVAPAASSPAAALTCSAYCSDESERERALMRGALMRGGNRRGA